MLYFENLQLCYIGIDVATEIKPDPLYAKSPALTAGARNLVQWPQTRVFCMPEWAGFAPYTDHGLGFPPFFSGLKKKPGHESSELDHKVRGRVSSFFASRAAAGGRGEGGS